jgi:hypothetical protein
MMYDVPKLLTELQRMEARHWRTASNAEMTLKSHFTYTYSPSQNLDRKVLKGVTVTPWKILVLVSRETRT